MITPPFKLPLDNAAPPANDPLPRGGIDSAEMARASAIVDENKRKSEEVARTQEEQFRQAQLDERMRTMREEIIARRYQTAANREAANLNKKVVAQLPKTGLWGAVGVLTYHVGYAWLFDRDRSPRRSPARPNARSNTATKGRSR